MGWFVPPILDWISHNMSCHRWKLNLFGSSNVIPCVESCNSCGISADKAGYMFFSAISAIFIPTWNIKENKSLLTICIFKCPCLWYRNDPILWRLVQYIPSMTILIFNCTVAENYINTCTSYKKSLWILWGDTVGVTISNKWSPSPRTTQWMIPVSLNNGCIIVEKTPQH